MRGSSKRRNSILLMVVVGVLCFVGSAATAATVALNLRDNGDGTFDLYASTSIGDNFGIAYYNIDLVNILTATHQSPVAFSAAVGGMVGFSGARADLTGPGALFAYQDTLVGNAPANLIYGIGQTAGTFGGTIFSDEGIPWTAPVLLASGTYDPEGPAPWFGQETPVNVFTQEWTSGLIPEGLVEAGEYFPLTLPTPHADAGGPYVIDAGETLNLDGTGSLPGLGSAITSYSWDLDNDGSFETAGGSPNLSYSYLESLGLGVGGPYDIGLEVWNHYGYSDTDSSQLTITPEPATLGLLIMGGLALLKRRR